MVALSQQTPTFPHMIKIGDIVETPRGIAMVVKTGKRNFVTAWDLENQKYSVSKGSLKVLARSAEAS